MNLIDNQAAVVLEGDDGIHQVLTSLRHRLAENPADSLNIIDKLAAQFGVMHTDNVMALTVARTCGFASCLMLAA